MLKKFVKTSVIVGAVVAALGVTTQVDAASCGTVTASSLYVRSGASTKYKKIGYIAKNETVDMLGVASSGWYKVKLSDGTVGYASNLYLNEIQVIIMKIRVMIMMYQ